MSDVVWQALIAAAVTIILAWMQYKTKQAADNNFAQLQKTTDSTHTLVNSNYEVQLILVADLSREKANKTGVKEDVEAAELAELMLKQHKAKQTVVDRQAELKGS